jgi:peptidoglycan/LPS O-acetylase OafA/YrhL
MICETFASRTARLGRANGFDGLRLALALGIATFHSFTIATGGTDGMPPALQAAARLILPAFFAISGYLVSASLARCATVREFLILRLLRIMPALCVVVSASALLLGPMLTDLPLRLYFGDPGLPVYFRNIVMQFHFALPGLFMTNPRPFVVNGSLWTLPIETICYGVLAGLALMLRGRKLLTALSALTLLLLFPLLPFVGLLLAWLPAKELVLAFCGGALLFLCARRVPYSAPAGVVSLCGAFLLARDPAMMGWASILLSYGTIWLAMRRIPASLTRADYSYGVYLTAYPLEQAWMRLCPGCGVWWADLLFAIPLAMIAAAVLWHGVEKPLLSRKHEIIARMAFPPARAASLRD